MNEWLLGNIRELDFFMKKNNKKSNMLALCWLAATSVFKHSFALTVTKNNLSERNVGKRKTLGGKEKVLFTSSRLRISIDCEKSSKKEETAQCLDNGASRLMLLGDYHQKNLIRARLYVYWIIIIHKAGIKVHVKIG